MSVKIGPCRGLFFILDEGSSIMIQINNLTKSFGKNIIVNDINLTIADGKVLGIVGASGAGKSSLIRMINGLMSPTSGTVLIDNILINELPEAELRKIRKDIGMIFQNFNLLDQKDVYNNVKLSLDVAGKDKKYSDQRIKELLDLVGLTPKIHAYPKTLSGGEKQRVAIARAIANNPKYLLCDEVTSALDRKTSYEILDLLQRINELYNITIVFVSHDLEAIKYICSEVIVMEEGTIIEKNNTLDLFMQPNTKLAKQLINKKMFNLSSESSEDIYQITYLDKQSNNPVISKASRIYDVEINIIYGEVIEINKQNIGFLYVGINGPDKEKAIDFLKSEVEVNLYV
ncbi:MAG TPA: methionine ABC transporter ATP-binding protein [Acholeplasmataceae bacterium]|nr:methionine ABC transporter ATP-binding protein [Acholeplasmataceae bacterium]